MRSKRNNKKQSALDRMLEHHKKSCTYFIFSGDRHCSCGRDEAIKELAELRERAGLPLFAQRDSARTEAGGC